MTVSDETLWTRAIGGDGEAFGVVFDRHRARLSRHAAGLVQISADAEDVVAVAFLEAWRKRDSIRFVDGSMLPWLLRTATFTAANLTRASRRYRDALKRLPPAADHVDAIELETHSDVMSALKALPMTDQQILTLCVLEGLTTDQAAGVLRLKPGSVRTRLSRARSRLRRALDPHTEPVRPEGAANVL